MNESEDAEGVPPITSTIMICPCPCQSPLKEACYKPILPSNSWHSTIRRREASLHWSKNEKRKKKVQASRPSQVHYTHPPLGIFQINAWHVVIIESREFVWELTVRASFKPRCVKIPMYLVNKVTWHSPFPLGKKPWRLTTARKINFIVNRYAFQGSVLYNLQGSLLYNLQGSVL